ncbi:hypothetical protein SAMN05660472_00676 [Natronincola ferrireducens]|uniref:Uncharacterized protein n=1 Tax=Natronincola ferrireducens TaxID=393762 RepID=A0A1G8YYM5_9FIRM|nr:hypothetical protein SAMN05660472_00676 [Natronincola ferrireducens]
MTYYDIMKYILKRLGYKSQTWKGDRNDRKKIRIEETGDILFL